MEANNVATIVTLLKSIDKKLGNLDNKLTDVLENQKFEKTLISSILGEIIYLTDTDEDSDCYCDECCCADCDECCDESEDDEVYEDLEDEVDDADEDEDDSNYDDCISDIVAGINNILKHLSKD